MNTPIVDFVREYVSSGSARLHMPGHKGASLLGCEAYDITEIVGADSLYEADGIIRESESNASAIFSCPTYYSTEGSSLCIRAMMYLLCQYARSVGQKPLIFAGRNAHKTFISSVALLDFQVKWLTVDDGSYLSCNISSEALDKMLTEADDKPTAVYLTSPDYLGNMPDIAGIAKVCHKHNVLLAVDNAHGAYLKFLEGSLHPIDNGADICCDSAHKTLPALTGSAYLHISQALAEKSPEIFCSQVKNSLALFGSTSPSYLILQSLDLTNKYIADGYRGRLCEFVKSIDKLKNTLISNGFTLCGNEPMKITIATKKYGYYGHELAEILLKKNIVCEFFDPDFLTVMLTPSNSADDIEKFATALLSIDKKPTINLQPPQFTLPEAVLTPREATMSASEIVPVTESIGRILSFATVGCPPAVPIVVSGERIDTHAVRAFEYYGINNCVVIKK